MISNGSSSQHIFRQQLVDDTKEEAKQRGITAEVYGEHLNQSISARCNTLQKVSKKCMTIGVLVQGEITRVLNELSTAMKTYQATFNVRLKSKLPNPFSCATTISAQPPQNSCRRSKSRTSTMIRPPARSRAERRSLCRRASIK